MIALIGCADASREELLVATAANMQFVMQPLAKSFTEETGIKCETIISSSGKLTAQIKEGAPYDVFVSADMKYPNELHESGMTISKPAIYARGKIVLWSADENTFPSIDYLKNTPPDHIALANPKTAPYGMAAIEVLKKNGLFENLKDKLVYGESIAQVNQFVLSGAAEVGFTAKSVVMSPVVKEKGNWMDLNDEEYTPIEQGIVILKNSEKTNEAQRFLDFIFSEKGKMILKEYGYEVD
jgi:molybdate transport system substrate-binding protein